MEQEEIKALLDRFFSGETSEEEEARVREILSDPALLELFSAEKEYLSHVSQKVPEPSEHFFANLEALTHAEKKPYRRSTLLRYGLSVAAGAAMLLGSYMIFDYMRPHEWSDTYDDPHLAMAEVKSILTMVSGNMRAATEPLSPMRNLGIAPSAIKDLGLINDAVGNNLARLRYLNKMDQSPKTTGNDNK
ncbi:MAG: hypothetical protein MUC78_11155 [Bacteroidales bacterium]|nr:hypothetical protein [Bacteroidales bacterium]